MLVGRGSNGRNASLPLHNVGSRGVVRLHCPLAILLQFYFLVDGFSALLGVGRRLDGFWSILHLAFSDLLLNQPAFDELFDQHALQLFLGTAGQITVDGGPQRLGHQLVH